MSTHTHHAKKHEKEEQSSSSSPAPESDKLNPGAPESPLRTPESDKKRGIKEVKPVKSPGKLAFDIESHKVTELFEPDDVVFTREGGAGELRAQPRHEADTRFAEIDGEITSVFKNAQTTATFKLKDGRTVHQTGHHTTIVDKDGGIDEAGPRLNIHAADFQG